MAYFELVEKYFESRRDLHSEIEILSKRRKSNLLGKLSSDRNEINFMSWLSEMKFGLRLDKAFQNLSYDFKLHGKTPDWFVTSYTQKLIFEVVRINRPEQELFRKIEEFKSPDRGEKNIVATSIVSGELDGKYFYGNIDKIEAKEISYRRLVEENEHNLVICIDCSEPDLFTFYNDFYDFFIADGKHGYFDSNPSFGKNVSALFIQVPFDGFKLIVNEKCSLQLNEDNLSLIRSVCD